MIRVAFLIRSLNFGGAERQLVTLVKSLDKDQFDVSVITFYSGGRLENELIEAKINLISLNKRGRWDLFPFLRKLIAQLKTLRPDILHSYLVEPNLLAVFLKPLFRSTRIVWGVLASNMDLGNYDWFVRVNFRLQSLASRFADVIISNSEAGRRYHVAQGFPPQKCIVIRNGIDTLKFRPDREAGKLVRQTWGVSDSAVLIGLIGRIDPNKDHETFLKAAATIAVNNAGILFVCVGAGSEAQVARLHRFAAELGIGDRVIWAGERDDMPATYNALDIVCSSSVSEGLPYAIAEAMACGVPCVVTDVGDSALLVGDTGLVVPAGNPAALADGLLAAIKRLKSGTGPDARSRIEEHFSKSLLKDQSEETFRKIVLQP